MIIEPYSIKGKNGKTLEFSSPTLDDANELAAFEYKVATETEFVAAPEDMKGRDYIKRITERNESEYSYWAKCTVDGKIVGQFNGHQNDHSREKHSGFFGISILSDYWGLGIGTEFIRYYKEWAKKRGITQLSINMIEGNDRALALYEKMGFKLLATVPSQYRYEDGSTRGRCLLFCDMSKE